MKKYAVAALALAIVVGASAVAQNLNELEIKEVKVSGLERISEQAVRSQLEVQPGQIACPRCLEFRQGRAPGRRIHGQFGIALESPGDGFGQCQAFLRDCRQHGQQRCHDGIDYSGEDATGHNLLQPGNSFTGVQRPRTAPIANASFSPCFSLL